MHCAHIFEIHALVHAFFPSLCVNKETEMVGIKIYYAILFISKHLKYWNCRRVSLRVWPKLLIKNDERFCVHGLNLFKNRSIYRAISSQYASSWLYLVVLGRICTRLYHEGGEQNFWFGFWYELMAANCGPQYRDSCQGDQNSKFQMAILFVETFNRRVCFLITYLIDRSKSTDLK